MMENKISFKKVFLTAFTLMMVAGIAGALIVCLNLFTEPIIDQNNLQIEEAKKQEIYPEATFEEIKMNVEGEDLIVYRAKKDGETLGYVYKMSGKNAYGAITMLVGINKDGVVKRSVIMENTESFATDINKQFNNRYHKDMTKDDINNVDVKGGATYGAKLIKELINQALDIFEHYQKEED